MTDQCACAETRDDETGQIFRHYCEVCAARDGHCECHCDCGDCLYGDGCGYVPSEDLCRLCTLRLNDESKPCEPNTSNDLISYVPPILSVVTHMVDQAKESLNSAKKIYSASCEYIQQRLDSRLIPCLSALQMVKDKSEWSTAVICEVKDILCLEGFADTHKECGLPWCACHLRTLNTLVAQNIGGGFPTFEKEAVAIEDTLHLASDAVKLYKRIAEDGKNDEESIKKEAAHLEALSCFADIQIRLRQKRLEMEAIRKQMARWEGKNCECLWTTDTSGRNSVEWWCPHSGPCKLLEALKLNH